MLIVVIRIFGSAIIQPPNPLQSEIIFLVFGNCSYLLLDKFTQHVCIKGKTFIMQVMKSNIQSSFSTESGEAIMNQNFKNDNDGKFLLLAFSFQFMEPFHKLAGDHLLQVHPTRIGNVGQTSCLFRHVQRLASQ